MIAGSVLTLTESSAAAQRLRGLRMALVPVLVRLVLLALVAFPAGFATTIGASAEVRSLKLYYVQTKEKAEIVFKRNGRYDQAGLKELNRFLRDWRRNEPTKMDPQLFDLVWEVYRQSKSNEYINVVSAYRSPATNDMLRRTRGGQAKKSQHMVGRAMDFYIPGVKLATLRGIAMKLQGGGVGYYPKSGSPFVHLDVANVRAWPRMSRQELSRLFPDGKTLHLPPDGKPLPGYDVALADYKRRGGAVASAGGSKRSGGLLAALFGGGDEDDEVETSTSAAKPAAPPARTEVAALPGVADSPAPSPVAEVASIAPVRAPIPVARPVTEPAVVVAALAAPEPILPAQAEINAFAAAANAEVLPVRSAAVELANIRAPIPLMLAERAVKPEPDPALSASAVEVAALPTPRPIRERLLTAATPSAPDTQMAFAAPDAATLSPEAIKASVTLPAGEDFVPLPIRRPGHRADDRRTEPAAPAIELASLASVPAQRGDRVTAVSWANATPRKGDRPTAAAVADQPQRTAIRTEPKLTETIISNWALARESVSTMPMPHGKARNILASQLRAAPKVVYANSFAQNGGDLPHNQFTGSAVNFLSVARFGN